MSYTYDRQKRPDRQKTIAPEQTTASGPDINALMRGTAAPSAAQKGRPLNLDAAMKAKMEKPLGTCLP